MLTIISQFIDPNDRNGPINTDPPSDDQYSAPGMIDENNYQQYLADDEGQTADGEDFTPEIEPDIPPTEPPEPDVQDIPYKNPRRLMNTGIDQLERITFRYINRHGRDAGWRERVEPHYTFIATTTGNEVLVTFDNTPGVNDIRAFIVGNIQPDGVRHKGDYFEPRESIMRGIY